LSGPIARERRAIDNSRSIGLEENMKNFASRNVITAIVAAAIAGCSHGEISNPIQQEPSATVQLGQVVGGATKQMTVDAPEVGKFLPQPELLAPGGPGKADLVYLDPNANFPSYHKVLIDPVTIWAGPNSELNSVPADQQRALANAAYSDIYNALKGSCQMVQKAEPNTIHLRFALVDTKEPNATINTVATYAPYASTAYSVASFAFNKGVGYFSGTATGEGFATDATSGKLLWEAVDKRGGTTALVANTLDNWRDARHVFEAWGVQLRTRLQELGVCRKQA
jgi:hypothetical protein